jgi:hypothetical protein
MDRRFVFSAVSAVFVAIVAAAWPRVARAEPLERGALRLEWSAPGGCPNAVEVVERIETLLGTRVADLAPEPIAARGRVRQIEPLRYELELETHQRDQRFTRSMQAPSCAELSDAGALVLALAIDPALAERRARAAEQKPLETSTPPVEPAAAEPVAPKPRVAPIVDAPPPVLRSRDEPRENRTERASAREWSARIGLLADVGTISTGAAFGMQVAAGLGVGLFRGELGISWLPSVRTVTAVQPDRGGDIDFLAAALSGCAFPFRGPVDVRGCAGFELGRLHGAGFGTVVESEGSAPWYGFGASGVIRLKASESMAAVVSGGFVMGLQDVEFTLENVGVVHRVSGAVARFTLGLEAGFP